MADGAYIKVRDEAGKVCRWTLLRQAYSRRNIDEDGELLHGKRPNQIADQGRGAAASDQNGSKLH
ncbi:MAG: hypothetical protein WBD21_10090, partial [Candidatus Acidiferrales bacterium]